MSHLLLASALLASPQVSSGAAKPVPAEKAAAPVAAAEDTYLGLVEAFFIDSDTSAIMEQMMRQIREQMVADAEMKELERNYPGILSQLLAALRPAMQRMADKTEVQFRRDLGELFKTRLTPQEAKEAAAFFASPAGSRMLRAANENLSMTNSLKDVFQGDGTVTASSFQSDMKKTTERAGVTEEEQREMRRMVAGRIWFMQFRSLVPQIQELSIRTMNEPGTPEEDAEFERIARQVIDKRMAAKENPPRAKD